MATYIRGTEVANATTYELYNRIGETHIKLATSNSLEFNLDTLGLPAGEYILSVKATAEDFEDSDKSNELHYIVAEAE